MEGPLMGYKKVNFLKMQELFKPKYKGYHKPIILKNGIRILPTTYLV